MTIKAEEKHLAALIDVLQDITFVSKGRLYASYREDVDLTDNVQPALDKAKARLTKLIKARRS